jgi:hypothetical protein
VSHGGAPLKIGVTMFTHASNTPEALLSQAFALARRGSAPS